MYKAICWMMRAVVTSAYGNENLKSMSGILQKLSEVMQNMVSPGSDLEHMYGLFVAFGTGLLVVYLAIDIVSSASVAPLTTEGVVRSFTRMMIGYLFLTNGFTIASGFAKLGAVYAETLLTKAGTQDFGYEGKTLDTMLSAMKTYMENHILSNAPFVMLKILIPFALIFVVRLVVLLVAVERLYEIAGRIVLAPIALSAFYSRGVFDAGARYIKRILSRSLQIVAIITILWGTPQLTYQMSQQNNSLLSGYKKTFEQAEADRDKVLSDKAKEDEKPLIVKGLTFLGDHMVDAFDWCGARVANITFGEKGEEEWIDGCNSLLRVFGDKTYNDDAATFGAILDSYETYGYNASVGLTKTSTLIYLCAMQVAMIVVLFGSQSLIDDMLS